MNHSSDNSSSALIGSALKLYKSDLMLYKKSILVIAGNSPDREESVSPFANLLIPKFAHSLGLRKQ
jgi:hypothetical protein